MAGDVSYQLYESYFQRARDAEAAGRIAEAKKMYYMAAEALLKSAKGATGDVKKAQIARADKLVRLADLLQVPARPGARTDAGGAGGARADAARIGATPSGKTNPVRQENSSNSDESNTVWQAQEKPDVGFDDIAGLADVKDAIRKRVILPRLHPEVYEAFNRKVAGGILLYGPPGTGKTMIAKAVAREVDAKFFSVRCSDVVGKYFGEAERNVKSLFETARGCDNAVIFFDEFEALAARRGGHSTVMNRLVPELLSQMDGFSTVERNNVMILAATNRPWDLDSAFLRPPRLTEKVYVGLPDYEARLFLIEKNFKNVPHEEGVTCEDLAQHTDGYNAADIVALCGAIKDIPIARTIENGGEISPVTVEDVAEGLEKIQSSVQKDDIRKILAWEQSQGK